jgi:hypothetical protein
VAYYCLSCYSHIKYEASGFCCILFAPVGSRLYQKAVRQSCIVFHILAAWIAILLGLLTVAGCYRTCIRYFVAQVPPWLTDAVLHAYMVLLGRNLHIAPQHGPG